jgi:spore maturation protein B
MIPFLQELSNWALPFLLAAIPIVAYMRKVPLYETFIEGAKDGFGTAVSLIPHLVAMLVAVTVFRESGALDLVLKAIHPVASFLHIPTAVIPLGLLRSISGSGSTSVLLNLFDTYGPDSFVGKLGSTMMGASDTTLYVLTVYFGSVGIQKIRYALKVGLLSDLVSVIASIVVVTWFFGSP